MNNSNYYLPIGSVVLLKNGNKSVMIYGRNQIRDIDNTKYDYLACLYPEGNISSQMNVFFNAGDIKEILFEGYKSKEEKEFVLKHFNNYY